jgi:hypothetical protein
MSKLRAEVAAKYRLRDGVQATVVHTQKPQRISFDLSKISLEEADELVEKGYNHLQLIEVEPPAKGKTIKKNEQIDAIVSDADTLSV